MIVDDQYMDEVARWEESGQVTLGNSRISGTVMHVTVLFSVLCSLSMSPSNFLKTPYGLNALRLPVA